MKRTVFSGFSTWRLEVDEPDHVVIREHRSVRAWPAEARRRMLYPWLGCGGVAGLVAGLMAWDALSPLRRGFSPEWTELLVGAGIMALWASPALLLAGRGQRWEARPGELVLGGRWPAGQVRHVELKLHAATDRAAGSEEFGGGATRVVRTLRITVVPRSGRPRFVASIGGPAIPPMRRWLERLCAVAGVEVKGGRRR